MEHLVSNCSDQRVTHVYRGGAHQWGGGGMSPWGGTFVSFVLPWLMAGRAGHLWGGPVELGWVIAYLIAGSSIALDNMGGRSHDLPSI